MQSPELEVSVTLVGVVQLIGIGDFGDERARIFGQRVEEDAIHDDAHRLGVPVSDRILLGCSQSSNSSFLVPQSHFLPGTITEIREGRVRLT